MKLGTETASVHNWVMAGTAGQPEVGKGMLELMWTDRRVWEVLWVSDNKKEVVVGLYSPSHDSEGYVTELGDVIPGSETTLKFRHGKWKVEGYNGWSKMNVIFGSHRGYRDPHF